tara:strand:- start:6418 stop:6798 length:381 start_codon:yes stop_codon:yes gene_type:complete
MNDPYHCLLSDLKKEEQKEINNIEEKNEIDKPKTKDETYDKKTSIEKNNDNDKKIQLSEYIIKKITDSHNIRNTLILTIVYFILNSSSLVQALNEKTEFLFINGSYNTIGHILICLILSSIFIFSF